MFENAKLGLKALKESVAEAEPQTLEGKSAMAMMEIYAEAERVAAAGKALMARRVADSGAWRSSGEKSPAHWMASKTGTSVGQAVNVLETAARLTELPQTEQALRSGELSETQAKEIASAAAAAPGKEGDLLKVAAKEDLLTLKERCARVKAATGCGRKRAILTRSPTAPVADLDRSGGSLPTGCRTDPGFRGQGHGRARALPGAGLPSRSEAGSPRAL